MKAKVLPSILCSLFAVLPACSGTAEETRASPEASVRTLSEGLFLKKSTQAEQAAVRAQNPSDFSVELRPRVSDDNAGIGLRIYLPNRWSQAKLRERLELVAQSEELRVAELEGQELLAVYRDFCTYRMLRKQIALYADEMELLEPFLGQADQSVRKRELAAADRAKLYSLYLDLVNNRDKLEMARIEIQRDLHRALGSSADLEAFAEIAQIELPSELELEDLLQQALEHRADYRRLGVDAQALETAQDLARAKDGFRFKYIQPAYDADYAGGQDTWTLSAAFELPWGARNPEIAALQEKRELANFEMALQRRIVKERLQALLQASAAFQEQRVRRNRLIRPLLDQLASDVRLMENGPLEQLRDRLQILQSILDSAVQSAAVECKREQLAIDFAEELGRLQP